MLVSVASGAFVVYFPSEAKKDYLSECGVVVSIDTLVSDLDYWGISYK